MPNHSKKNSQQRYRDDEIKVYGVNICQTIFASRPADLIKVYILSEKRKKFAHIIEHCVRHKKGYNLVQNEDLEKLTQSVHHEGICMIVREPKTVTVTDMLAVLKKSSSPVCLLCLDGVQNSHNLGNILRTAAHFGVPFVLVNEPNFITLPASARRVSEGGAEFVRVVFARDLSVVLKNLQEMGFLIVATSSHANKELNEAALAPKTVFVMGDEVGGISEAVSRQVKTHVSISGTGHVESLNVATATAICVSQWWQKRKN